MELQRGMCSLCAETSKVLITSDAQEICKLLPEIFAGSFLTEQEFQTIKKYLKICMNCCFKVQFAHEMKELVASPGASGSDVCHFCHTDNNIVEIESNWKYFNVRTEGYLNTKEFPIYTCCKCLFFFDILYNIKTKLCRQFRKLVQNRPQTASKRKSTDPIPLPAVKKQKTHNCFEYLQPLSKHKYHVQTKLKRDKKLFRTVAYVNLFDQRTEIKETPKKRPIIKIKLKPVGKHAVAGRKTQSEEGPKKHKSSVRRQSMVEDAGLNETPKVAADLKLAPKRRVSNYIIQTNDSEENDNDKEEDASVSNIEKIDEIVEKYIEKKDETSDAAEESVQENDNEALEDSKQKEDEEEASSKTQEQASKIIAEEKELTAEENDTSSVGEQTENVTESENAEKALDNVEILKNTEKVLDDAKKASEDTEEALDNAEEIPKNNDESVDAEDSTERGVNVEAKEVNGESKEMDEVGEALVEECKSLEGVDLTEDSNDVELIEKESETRKEDGDDSNESNDSFIKLVENNDEIDFEMEKRGTSPDSEFLNGSDRKKKRVTFSMETK